tara:strand:- start:278 stop:478 length:201 start_codon:yes stop_codon:yes gene_type:complete
VAQLNSALDYGSRIYSFLATMNKGNYIQLKTKLKTSSNVIAVFYTSYLDLYIVLILNKAASLSSAF